MRRYRIFFVFLFLSLPLFAENENILNADNGESAQAAVQTVLQAEEPIAKNETEDIIQRIINFLTAETRNVAVGTASADMKTAGILVRLGIALAVIAVQVFLILLVWRIFRTVSGKIRRAGEKIQPLKIKNLKILGTRQIIHILLFWEKVIKYVITGVMIFLTLPIVFSLFPATRNFAATLFYYLLHPIRDIALGIVGYIPNLIPIIIIIFITRYVLKGLKFFSGQISKGKITLPGFYADWAEPTFNILRVLILAFTIALIFPYLPGSDTRVFQGVSVLVGLLFSIGSSSAIGNVVAGLVLTYMRPFKIGDRVKINETIGFIEERHLMIVRVRTHKNEFVTFPNTMLLNASIINYTASADEKTDGLILNTEITAGYATSWQAVHEILINAALAADYVQKNPKPFVLQTSLDDFYARYQINCYTKEINKIPAIYAQLYENIQNGFQEAGLDMTTSHYQIIKTEK